MRKAKAFRAVWPWKIVFTAVPVSGSQTRAELSALAEYNWRPSSENTNAAIGPRCPASVARGRPVSVSQMRIRLPSAQASVRPSGEKARQGA